MSKDNVLNSDEKIHLTISYAEISILLRKQKNEVQAFAPRFFITQEIARIVSNSAYNSPVAH